MSRPLHVLDVTAPTLMTLGVILFLSLWIMMSFRLCDVGKLFLKKIKAFGEARWFYAILLMILFF